MFKRLLIAALLLPGLAGAQSVSIGINLPVVLPPMVVVQPGVQVVRDYDEEVFYTGGYYYVRQDGGWYRSRDHRRGWVLVPARGVPPALVRMPPGQYRHYRPAPAPVRYTRPGPAPVYERREVRREERREDRREDRREHDRGEHRGHGNGHGKGHDKHDHD